MVTRRIIFAVEEKLFQTEPVFILGGTYVQMQRYLKRRFGIDVEDDLGSIAGKMLTFQREPWRVVWIKRPDDIGLLVHETFHLVTRICADKGIPIVSHIPSGEIGDEAAAYMLGFFVTAALARLKRKRIRGK